MADNFDKFLPDWQIGTLTLTANSTAFTATDALLTFGSIQQGDFIISPDGRMLIIESITDDSNGVLSSPCPPEAAGTFPTRIRYQSDNSRYTGQTAALRRLMSGGNLFSLAKLTGDPETVVRFLGSGAFDLVDASSFGLQDPTGSLGKLAALELGNRQILQTDETGVLKTLALAASKFLRTDANGDLALSDLGAAAIALLNLAGTAAANKLPYLSSATAASLADFTAAARALLNLAGTAAANQLPYLTAGNAAGLTPLTAFARTILDDANGAAVWATLGNTTGSSFGHQYWAFPSGMVIIIGTAAGTTDSNAALAVTFPTAFPNTNYQIIPVGGEVTIPTMNVVWSRTVGACSFQIYNTNGTPRVSGAARVNYIAIGGV